MSNCYACLLDHRSSVSPEVFSCLLALANLVNELGKPAFGSKPA